MKHSTDPVRSSDRKVALALLTVLIMLSEFGVVLLRESESPLSEGTPDDCSRLQDRFHKAS